MRHLTRTFFEGKPSRAILALLDAYPPDPQLRSVRASGTGETSLGDTTVECSVTDTGGKTTSGSFTLTVVDTTPG